MDTVCIDFPLWFRIAVYLWLFGKAYAYITDRQDRLKELRTGSG